MVVTILWIWMVSSVCLGLALGAMIRACKRQPLPGDREILVILPEERREPFLPIQVQAGAPSA